MNDQTAISVFGEAHEVYFNAAHDLPEDIRRRLAVRDFQQIWNCMVRKAIDTVRVLDRKGRAQCAELTEWRLMESAPTDVGSRVMVFAPSPGVVGIADGAVGEAFLGNDGRWYWAGSDVGYHDHIGEEGHAAPARWMPLPATPVSP